MSLEDGSLQQEECDEEEAWLDALETGSVNKRGYLPSKVKDPAAMTARQVGVVYLVALVMCC